MTDASFARNAEHAENYNEDWIRTLSWDIRLPDGTLATTLAEVAFALGLSFEEAALRITRLPFGQAAPPQVQVEARRQLDHSTREDPESGGTPATAVEPVKGDAFAHASFPLPAHNFASDIDGDRYFIVHDDGVDLAGTSLRVVHPVEGERDERFHRLTVWIGNDGQARMTGFGFMTTRWAAGCDHGGWRPLRLIPTAD